MTAESSFMLSIATVWLPFVTVSRYRRQWLLALDGIPGCLTVHWRGDRRGNDDISAEMVHTRQGNPGKPVLLGHSAAEIDSQRIQPMGAVLFCDIHPCD